MRVSFFVRRWELTFPLRQCRPIDPASPCTARPFRQTRRLLVRLPFLYAHCQRHPVDGGVLVVLRHHAGGPGRPADCGKRGLWRIKPSGEAIAAANHRCPANRHLRATEAISSAMASEKSAQADLVIKPSPIGVGLVDTRSTAREARPDRGP